MEIKILDTYNLYKELINLPEENRLEFYEINLAKPFEFMYNLMNMKMEPEMMGYLPLNGHDDEINDMLDMLQEENAWSMAKEALEESAERFKNIDIDLPESITLGIFIGNSEFLANMKGYTGMGSIPGYIQIVIAPNEYNLPRLKSIIAHEFHHNVLMKNVKWNFMNVSVSQYIALEGLAESFAASLYRDEFIGPWVTSVQGKDLEKSFEIIGNALDITGFNEVRKYVFGDQLLNVEGCESTGISVSAGYAVGYHAVQGFLKNTGISVEEATLIDSDIIMKKSGCFI